MISLTETDLSNTYPLPTLKSHSIQQRCLDNEMDSFAGLSLDERKLIIGIDFGTTFSGLAWAETRRVSENSLLKVLE